MIPCYQESKTVQNLLDELRDSPLNTATVIIVDDSENEISSRTAQRWLENYGANSLKVLLQSNLEKGGRGRAVLSGIRVALTNPEIECVIEMDADGSHRVEDVISIALALKEETIVLGSRYLSESIILGWPLHRRLFSWILNRMIPIIFRLKTSDVTNGLRGYQRIAACELLNHDFLTSSFISLTESLLVLRKIGLNYSEVPICFRERSSGRSTVRMNEITNSLRGLLTLLKNSGQFK